MRGEGESGAESPPAGQVIRIQLKINTGGTRGDEVWAGITPFVEISRSAFGPSEGSSGPCLHAAEEPHLPGEWQYAVVEVDNDVLAMYAVAHYQRQARVLDATIEE